MSSRQGAVIIFGYRITGSYDNDDGLYHWRINDGKRTVEVCTTADSVLNPTKKIEGMEVVECEDETLLGDVTHRLEHHTMPLELYGIDTYYSESINRFYKKYKVSPTTLFTMVTIND